MTIPNINLEAEIADFRAKCARWSREKITADNASLVRDAIALGTELSKRIETIRRGEKKPHEDAAKAVDATYRPMGDAVAEASNAAKRALQAFITAEEDRKRAEADAARKAAEEEARKAAEAAAAAKAEQEDPFAAFDAEEAQRAAQAKQREAEEAAKQAKRVNVASAEGGAKALGMRTYYEVVVTDGAALVAHFAKSPHIVEECRKLAASQVRAAKGDGSTIPGIEVREDRRIA